MIIILLIFALIYFGLLMLAAHRWKLLVEAARLPRDKSGASLFISVIIPARNEAQHIKTLLNALASQDFPADAFEVLLIDDHSEDKTIEAAKSLTETLPFTFTIIALAEIEAQMGIAAKGKKMALQKGIEKANGPIIVTTDADCMMEKGWLSSIHAYFAQKAAKMLVGPVAFHTTGGFFGQLQAIEFAALIGTGGVSLSLGRPNMCNGANLAFEKAAFEAVGGYKDNAHIPSGDDEFLLQKMHKHFPKQVFFNANPDGIVTTYPVKTLSAFIAQRKRWSGKWRQHKSLAVKLLAIFIFLFHLSFITAFLFTVLGMLSAPLFVIILLLKFGLEYYFIKKVLQYLGKSLYLKHFVVLQGIYSLYVCIFGILTNFGSFKWKERKYKA